MDALHLATADAAQAAFYAAFEAADLEAMMAVWAPDAVGVECVHPLGARLAGRRAIAASWRGIFASGERLRFRLADVRSHDAGGLAVRVVHEEIRFGRSPEQRSRVIATNVYRETDAGWRIVLHHGSPAETAPQPPGRSLH